MGANEIGTKSERIGDLIVTNGLDESKNANCKW